MFAADDPGPGMTFVEAVRARRSAARHARPPSAPTRRRSAPGKYKGAGVGPSPAYSFTACVVEAEVDERTGWIHVPKIWIAHDIGRALNPTLARGQVDGGVYMGLGEALMEEQSFRRLPEKLSGALVHRAPSMLDYKSLTALDMPEVEAGARSRIRIPNGPFGAKEVGQGPLLPVMPAVANAIYDAVGVRIDEMPITPDKVLQGLDEKRRAARASGRSPSRRSRTRSRRSSCRPGKAATATRTKTRCCDCRGLSYRAPRYASRRRRKILAGEGPRGDAHRRRHRPRCPT